MPQSYTDTYKEQAFYLWYDNDKCPITRLAELLPKNPDGRSPGSIVLTQWQNEFGWKERADALDADVSRKLDEDVINKRATMYARLAEIGQFEAEEGYRYLKEHGITKEDTALRAIADGALLQQRTVGQAEAWQKIATMTDEQIVKELERLTGRTQKKEFDVDAEVEEIQVDTESDDQNI